MLLGLERQDGIFVNYGETKVNILKEDSEHSYECMITIHHQ